MNMALSERIYRMEKEARENALNQTEMKYYENTKFAYEELYADLPLWERYTRTSAYGLIHTPVIIRDDDRIIGRYYFYLDDEVKDVGFHDIKFREYMTERIKKQCPELYPELMKYGLHGDFFVFGHSSCAYERILRLGIDGVKELCNRNLKRTKDPKSIEFYSGVLIMLDAVLEWNELHVQELERRGKHDLAEICRKVPKRPAETFHEALQSLSIMYLAVNREMTGTYGPGWLDYHLWPYLERDLAAGRCTMEEARELVAESFIRFDERILAREPHNDAVMLGGSHKDGSPAINPLTYLMTEVIMDLSITCLLVYLKMPENPPEEFVKLASNYLLNGKNRGMVLSDKAIAKALEYRGMPYTEALAYTSNGCMEISGPTNNSDLLLSGWHNIPKFVELAITGGRCLITGDKLKSVHFKGLNTYNNFEEFYEDFLKETKRILHNYFKIQDVMSECAEEHRPACLTSSLIDDCMIRGRNMHGGGARYHDYGTSPVGMPNATDALFAIKKAVFDNKICSADQLIEALQKNYEGFEVLRSTLRSLPKYGQDNEEADSFAAKFMNDICDIYESYENRLRGVIKPVIMTFIWANEAGALLGATADGNYAKTAVAQAVTPQSAAMSKGVTAAITSNTKIPYHRFTGGASTMWDFDPSWINQEILEGLEMTFIDLGGQMFQGNTSADVNELIKAKADPKSYQHLIVRVGGFSGRFVDLRPDVQDDIIGRYYHKK
jgi:pyruvate-formate lyase